MVTSLDRQAAVTDDRLVADTEQADAGLGGMASEAKGTRSSLAACQRVVSSIGTSMAAASFKLGPLP